MAKAQSTQAAPSGDNPADAAMTAMGTAQADPALTNGGDEANPSALETIETLTLERDTAIATLATATARIAELEALVPAPPPAKKAAHAMTLSAKATAADFADATMVCFTDENGVLVKGLTPLLFAADVFGIESGARILNSRIEFPLTLPAATACAAWLVTEGGKPVSRCELLSPFAIGGGRSQAIPAGSLAFRFG
jgi:hypothetical protein